MLSLKVELRVEKDISKGERSCIRNHGKESKVGEISDHIK